MNELQCILAGIISKQQVTFKVWGSTHQAIKTASAITGESMCSLVNRLVVEELKKLIQLDEKVVNE